MAASSHLERLDDEFNVVAVNGSAAREGNGKNESLSSTEVSMEMRQDDGS